MQKLLVAPKMFLFEDDIRCSQELFHFAEVLVQFGRVLLVRTHTHNNMPIMCLTHHIVYTKLDPKARTTESLHVLKQNKTKQTKHVTLCPAAMKWVVHQ